MLFYLMGSLRYYDDFVKQGTYAAGTLFTHHGRSFHELAGKQYGIIGMGTIGRRVAEVASAFGASVRYFSTTQKNLDTGYASVSLEELLTNSDVISVHCPLTPSTQNLIGYEQLCRMKNGAFLINAGRGGL
jgi:glycerate dehydrogenase